MIIEKATEWPDYQLLDTGDGARLERFGQYVLMRPDPQVLWRPRLDASVWSAVDAVFDTNRDTWNILTNVPEQWLLKYQDISFWAKLTPFKHTGVFPEQTAQWDWLKSKLQQYTRPARVLNLFAYTGIASLIAASCGATVTHVDASRPTIGWARDNQIASHLEDKPIRWILDDAQKFTAREAKRGATYDVIIMDPPVYGHGPKGERWNFQKDFPSLVKQCQKLLSNDPLCIIINAYAISASALMIQNVLSDAVRPFGGAVEAGELVIQEKDSERLLSTGIFARWSSV